MSNIGFWSWYWNKYKESVYLFFSFVVAIFSTVALLLFTFLGPFPFNLIPSIVILIILFYVLFKMEREDYKKEVKEKKKQEKNK